MPDVPDPTRLPIGVGAELDDLLADDDRARAAGYPGPRPQRQPAHTVYVPADRVDADLPRRWGGLALDLLAEHGGDPATLAAATGLDAEAVAAVLPGVLRRLAEHPVEDLRADLEDGYGLRPDAAEDADAAAAATALAALSAADPDLWTGVRCKCLEPATRRRAVATLDVVVGTLAARGGVPERFVVTVPKVTSVAQVRAFGLLCKRLEEAHGLTEGTLRFEVQVETPQAVLSADGTATVAAMVHEGGPRLSGLHYGTYDYSASLGVAGAWQAADHPVADHAKAVMLVAAAQTGVWVSDGSTNVLPVGDRDAVHAAWRLHARLVRRALEAGLWQGWDLHPGQLVTRHLTRAVVLRQALPAAVARLAAYRQGVAGGGVLDEPATARSLAGLVVRALDAGAQDEAAVLAALGTDRPGLESLTRA
ncbi:MAG: aldolase/citrate lyase family protein [Kineosporiaceae bacterium]